MRLPKALTWIAVAVALALSAESVMAGCGTCGKHRNKGQKKAAECTMEKCGKHPNGRMKAEQDKAVIGTAALAVLLESDTDVTLLDARSGKYDDGRRIPGASVLTAAASDEKIEKALPSRDALIVTYCSNVKCPASHQLAERLKKLGYTNVLEYPKGIEGWVEDGHDVVKTK